MKVCIAGCGVAIRHQIPFILGVPGAKIVGLCDISEEKLRQASKIYNITKGLYTDFGTMLEEEKPDVLHITTPPRTHASLAIHAMETGCHVLVEKPMTSG